MAKAIVACYGLIALLAVACSGGSGASVVLTPRPTATHLPSSGPAASVEPRSVPPGAVITVNGIGWPAGASVIVTGETDDSATAKPYANAVISPEGTFSVHFAIEKTASGQDLSVGRYDLIAMAAGTQITVPLQVESRRPLKPSDLGPGG